MRADWSSLRSIKTGILLLAVTTLADTQQSDGPVIIKPSESEIILQTGQNYTLECIGKNPIQFKQQDIPEDKTGDFRFEERYETSDNESEYKVALDLLNVDQFAVGYYACFDNTVNSTEVLRDVVEEPNNTAHISYVYIYVNGSTLFAPMRAFVLVKSDSKFVIECKPTTPDIKVQLTLDFADIESINQYSPKVGFIVDSDVLSDSAPNFFICDLKKDGSIVGSKDVIVHKYLRAQAPKPNISSEHEYYLDGESFSLNCTVIRREFVAVDLSWKTPGPKYKITNVTNAYNLSVDDTILYYNITVTNANKGDAGNYTCFSQSSSGLNSSSIEKIHLDKAILEAERQNPNDVIEVMTSSIQTFKIKNIRSYPAANVTVFRTNPKKKQILQDGTKYDLMRPSKSSFLLKIRKLAPNDTGLYTFVFSNGYLTKNITYELRVPGPPKVKFGPSRTDLPLKYTKDTTASLMCDAEGFRVPNITWLFNDGEKTTEIPKHLQMDNVTSTYQITSVLNLQVRISGNITCNATNKMGNYSVTRQFLVQEMPNGFGIENADHLWFAEGTKVAIRCLASKYDFNNVSWYDEDGEELPNVYETENNYSLVAILSMDHIRLDQAGNYVCAGSRFGGTTESQDVTVSVARTYPPRIRNPIGETQEVVPFQSVNMTCMADAVPPPTIEWLKDDVPLINNSNTMIQTISLDQTTKVSTVKIPKMDEEHAGIYKCVATSGTTTTKLYNIIMKEKLPYKTTYLSIAGVVFFILIVLVAYLTWKIRKEKQFRKELAAAGLLYFKEGVTKSINPDLGIDEQAELLPYDDKFEFPVEKLTLGKQLGAGAFGVVYKAEARGIVNAELSTTVAVKMVKKTADNMYIKALASELKIMVHLGRHINIVNLLGACTKNVGKRELIVIVEYCKFGNIHNYVQKHRDVFINQLTDNSEKNLGKVNRGYSSSSANSGMHSDYFGSNHTQETDNTFLNTANTSRSGRKDKQILNKQVELAKVSQSGYVQPEWRSNYESDYSFDGRSPRPLCSRDLLAWSFQIARGMEYLASRKVLHGDLAARNILLAEDNVVKICDFGLARSIYKNDEYQKKENSPLPVKWLAIECMTDRVFSTQSDVWSFGIVLWELFSLAKTPYPNISPPTLLQWLSEGHRLEKPTYADEKLYDVMRRCWAQKPTARPTFTQLQEIIGSFLEENVRNHYVDLNAMNIDSNVKKAGEEDYLAMVSAPDYNNLVTPSPHHYVNDVRSFFPPTPTQLQQDDEGYLQMSPASKQTIFNPRAQGTKFDFDARKLTPRVSEANSYGSESTPMLTLNNLPRSGSESDQEGNASPYLNMYPRIEEETDDVFGAKENNAKNIQPSAVTNPTYITMGTDDEKKSHNFANNYINANNIPNGLVK